MDLGAASGFAVLAGTGITVAGAVNTTSITGDIGTFPTPAITGLENVILTGTNHAGGEFSQLAKTDLVAAYANAAGRAYNVQYVGGYDLGGLTLSSGVYNSASSLFLTGGLTLDAQGNPDAVWIFQTGSTFITAANSMVNLVGGAQASNIFWQVGSSATLGTNTNFSGSILADTSITVTTGATIDGRMLASNGAVTLDSNAITVPQRVPGVRTVAGPSDFPSGSIFEWELDIAQSNPETNRGIAYDGLNTGEVTGSGAIFKIMLTGEQDFTDAFWNQTRVWTDIFKFADGEDILSDWASVFNGGFQYAYNGQSVAPTSSGSFALSGNTLTWSAVPEPSNLLAGLLMGSALLRRRRHG